MNKIVSNKMDELQKLCKEYSIKSMHVFGSVCTDRFNSESDIDFLISFKEITIEEYADNYFDLHYKLESLFNRKVDLLTENSLSNPYFIQGVEKTKELLYAA